MLLEPYSDVIFYVVAVCPTKIDLCVQLFTPVMVLSDEDTRLVCFHVQILDLFRVLDDGYDAYKLVTG